MLKTSATYGGLIAKSDLLQDMRETRKKDGLCILLTHWLGYPGKITVSFKKVSQNSEWSIPILLILQMSKFLCLEVILLNHAKTAVQIWTKFGMEVA